MYTLFCHRIVPGCPSSWWMQMGRDPKSSQDISGSCAIQKEWFVNGEWWQGERKSGSNFLASIEAAVGGLWSSRGTWRRRVPGQGSVTLRGWRVTFIQPAPILCSCRCRLRVSVLKHSAQGKGKGWCGGNCQGKGETNVSFVPGPEIALSSPECKSRVAMARGGEVGAYLSAKPFQSYAKDLWVSGWSLQQPNTAQGRWASCSGRITELRRVHSVWPGWRALLSAYFQGSS